MPPETAMRRWQARSGTERRKRPLAVRAICRHCEERSDEAIQNCSARSGLLRCARNDGFKSVILLTASQQPSLLRAQLCDFGIARKIVGALAIDRIHHDAFAVLQRGLANEGAQGRLVIDLAEGDLAER